MGLGGRARSSLQREAGAGPEREGVGLGKAMAGACLALLTCHGSHGERAQALPAVEPIDKHPVSASGLQAGDGGLTLVCGYRHHLELPIAVLVLDHEGVKLALGDGPREAHRAGGHAGHSQLPQARPRGPLGGCRSGSRCWS